MTEITILAVTRISDGVCVAGITSDGGWIRPTRLQSGGWRYLDYSDCEDKSGNWIVRKGYIVKMELIKHIPEGAHSEDWLIGARKPVLATELSDEDYSEICKEVNETSTDCIEGPDADRSLVLVHPNKFTAFDFAVETTLEGRRRYVPRCSFRLGRRPYPRVGISDAEWRGYGRQFLRDNGRTHRASADDIFSANRTRDCWLTLGRNQVNSNIYLLVTGVHLIPARHFEMDFGRV